MNNPTFSAPRKQKHGPDKAAVRWSTRLAAFYRKLCHSTQLKAIPIDCRALAESLGCSYETVVRITGRFASGGDATAWSFQNYGFIVFLRYRPHQTAKCGHPQYYVISRHGFHRIGGIPGKVRARLRQKTADLWRSYLHKIIKLAFGQFVRRSCRANDKHKGSPSSGTGRGREARPPPTANRPALRRFKNIASMLTDRYADIAQAPHAKIYGWALNRFGEGHSFARVLEKLEHAVKVMTKKEAQSRPWSPSNRVGWILGVASRHLDRDGLSVQQRLWSSEKRQAAGAATSSVKRQGSALKSDEESDWQRQYREVMSRRIKPSWET